MPLLFALLISFVVAFAGWLAGALTVGGGLAATAVGSAILHGAGWPGLAALGSFFVGASLVSRIAPDHSQARFDAKGNQRDALQVLANGGAAAIAALLLPSDAALWVVTASLAAAAADSWATAIGGWSRVEPRSIVTGRQVPAGTSGGVTATGTIGALAGGLTVAVSAGLIAGDWRVIASCSSIAILGMLLDSLLGATAQARFHCPACDQPTERARHRCGAESHLAGGVAWLTNDGVNGAATTAAALLGWLAWAVLRQG